MTKLWAIHIPGPDEYHAAPSESAAHYMAEKHTSAMREYIKTNKLDWAEESIKAEPVEWPFDADEHAKEMAEFDYAAWGIQK